MELNTKKITTLIDKIGPINISKLKNKVRSISPADWDTDEDFELNGNKIILNQQNKNVAALGPTKHIVLRFANKTVHPYQYLESERWKEWSSILLPVMNKATEHFNYKNSYYPKVMLANLPAKAFIRPHTDGIPEIVAPHKIHIPLFTNSECYFFALNKRFHFQEGYAFEVNNAVTHSVINNGETDRIHLLFECIDLDIQSDEIKTQISNRTITNNENV